MSTGNAGFRGEQILATVTCTARAIAEATGASHDACLKPSTLQLPKNTGFWAESSHGQPSEWMQQSFPCKIDGRACRSCVWPICNHIQKCCKPSPAVFKWMFSFPARSCVKPSKIMMQRFWCSSDVLKLRALPLGGHGADGELVGRLNCAFKPN